MTTAPAPAARRRTSRGTVAAVVAVAVLAAVLGGYAVFQAVSGGSDHQVPQLNRWLDAIPVPAGAVLIREQAYEANGDASAYASRQYRLPATPTSTDQVRAALERGAVTIADEGQVLKAADVPWSAWTTPTSGDLHALPPGTSGGGVEVAWKDDILTLDVQPGDVRG